MNNFEKQITHDQHTGMYARDIETIQVNVGLKCNQQGRIAIAPAEAITSGRRFGRLGHLRTMFINQLIICGCYLGVSPTRLASVYRKQ